MRFRDLTCGNRAKVAEFKRKLGRERSLKEDKERARSTRVDHIETNIYRV